MPLTLARFTQPEMRKCRSCLRTGHLNGRQLLQALQHRQPHGIDELACRTVCSLSFDSARLRSLNRGETSTPMYCGKPETAISTAGLEITSFTGHQYFVAWYGREALLRGTGELL